MPIGFNKNALKNSKKSDTVNSKATAQTMDTSKQGAATFEKKAAAKRPVTKVTTQNTGDDDDDDFNIEGTAKKRKNLLNIAILTAIVVLAGIVLFIYLGKDDTQPTITDAGEDLNAEDGSAPDNGYSDEDPYIYDEDGNPIYSAETNELVDDNAIDPGAPDYDSSDKSHTTPIVYGADDYLKDINGVAIAANYNVIRRDYVFDYVSYVAKRGIIDDGMEVYWLEADYEGKKYRIQVPFYYFKDFSETGVCRVQIEVLNIEGGGKVISYMNVVGEPET